MTTTHLPYKPQEYQKPYHNCSARFKNILGGTRSGKSYPTANEFFKRIIRDVHKHQGKTTFLPYWQVSPTYSLNAKMYRMLFLGTPKTKPVIPKRIIKSDRFRGPDKEVMLYYKGIDILISFKSTERPEKLVAEAIAGVWVDEAARCKPESWLGGIRERLSDFMGWALFSTSPIGKNWYYDEIFRRGDQYDDIYDDEYANFIFKTIQNEHIAKKEIEAARRQLPPKYFRREYEASLEEFMGQVYEEWSRDIHIYPNSRIPEIDHNKFKMILVGTDWGFRPNPGVFTLIGVTGDKFFQFEEVVDTSIYVNSDDKKADTWIKRGQAIRDRFPDKEVLFYPDPSEPGNISAFLDAGLECFEAINDVEPGIRQVSELLHPYSGIELPRYFVHKNCVHTIREMESYKRDNKGKILKKDDHCMDALRYGIVTYLVNYLGVDLIREVG